MPDNFQRKIKYAVFLLCLASAISLLDMYAPSANAVLSSGLTQTSTINVPLPASSIQSATGDVNGDLYPDLVVERYTPGLYFLVLNDGAGGFLPAVSRAIASNAGYLNLKDFNNDGKLDLFHMISAPSGLGQPWKANVQLGDGMGNFGSILTSNIPSNSIVDLVFANFNGDGFLDVAFSIYGPGISVPGGSVIVAMGDGAGRFTPGPYISLRPRGGSLAGGDFNQDGKQDLAMMSSGGSCSGCDPALQILLNDGAGGFSISNALTQTEFYLFSFSSGDMNNDGKIDLIGVRYGPGGIGTGGLGVLLGTGAGDFVLGGSINPGTISTNDVRVADFNGDNKLDAVYPNNTTNLAHVVFGNGQGGFTNSISLSTGETPRYLDIADFNRNGTPDLAVSNSNSNFLSVFIDPNASTPPSKTQFDFDGDLKADIAVYREGNTPNAPSYWHILKSSNGTYQGFQLGANGDKPIPADYNGDGRTEVAVWRPSTGYWYTSTDPATNYGAFHWGQTGDVPIPGDFDGDGKADYVVYRQSNSTWYVTKSSNGGYQEQQFGSSTDKPLLGDFDGDGKADFAHYRPGASPLANSFWNVLQSSNGAVLSVQFGRGEDKPVPADYDGDGRTNTAVFRPSTSTWYTSRDAAINYGAFAWGAEGDVPAPADYDHDNKADFAVYRPGSTVWYIRRSSNGTVLGQQWGVPSDTPVPASFIP